MSNQMDLFAGQQAQKSGLQSVEEHDQPFLTLMRKRAREIAEKKGSLSTDDLRVYGQCWNIKPAHPNAWGCIFKEAGWICIGRKPSSWKSNHGRVIRIWARQDK